MLRLISAAAVVGLVTHLAAAPAFAAGSCQVAMSKLMDEWQAVGYPAPQSKSAKDYVVGNERVLGNDGHVASGRQVAYMHGQISLASQECAQGNDAAALTRITKVSEMLDGQMVRTAGAVAH
jgi:hypothetical protein